MVVFASLSIGTLPLKQKCCFRDKSDKRKIICLGVEIWSQNINRTKVYNYNKVKFNFDHGPKRCTNSICKSFTNRTFKIWLNILYVSWLLKIFLKGSIFSNLFQLRDQSRGEKPTSPWSLIISFPSLFPLHFEGGSSFTKCLHFLFTNFPKELYQDQVMLKHKIMSMWMIPSMNIWYGLGRKRGAST